MCVCCHQHIEKVFKHKELEQQLVDAKLAQASLQMTEAKEQSLQEKQMVGTPTPRTVHGQRLDHCVIMGRA